MIGILVGLLLLALLGDALFRIFCRRDWVRAELALEAIGLRVLLALAAIPWLFVAMDLVSIPIRRFSIAVVVVGLEVVALAWTRRQLHSAPIGLRATWGELRRAPAALLLAAVALSLPVLSFVHIAVFPVRVYDALVGYDAVGRILALEGQFRSSVFTKLAFNAQCVYAPFTAANQGFWYLYWPDVPQLWVSLLVFGFVLILWSRARRWLGSVTAAGLAVFLSFTVPELAFHMSVGQTDLASMVFVALAVFELAEALRGRAGWASVALFALFATTVRSENMLFALALAVCGLVFGRGRRLRAIWILAPSAFFFAFWNLFFVRTLIGYNPARHFRSTIEFDLGRAGEVISQAANILVERQAFGELIWMLALIPIVWGFAEWRRVRSGEPATGDARIALTGLGILGVCFLFYLPFFYQWDPQLNPIWTMQHTLKRGYFRFVPGFVLAFLAAPPVLGWLRRCEPASAPRKDDGIR